MLSRPTIEFVKDECGKFNDECKLEEEALKKLRTFCPSNSDEAEVLLKVVVLDQLYNTRIDYIDKQAVAQHIAGLAAESSLDGMIPRGDCKVVELIYSCPGSRKLYSSFATKFVAGTIQMRIRSMIAMSMNVFGIIKSRIDSPISTGNNSEHIRG
jgi:hypothetical protein